MIRFEHPQILYTLFIIIPLFIGVYIIYAHKKRRAIKLFGEKHLIEYLSPEISKQRPNIKFILLLIATLLLIIGLANPQIGSKVVNAKRKGIDIMIALDISNSMLAQDIQPSRLERAKQTIQKLINQLENDRIGIVVFAGKAFIQLPITTDYAAAKLFLDHISPKMIASQGTNIGSAINQCINSFGEKNKRNRAIIVISDGEDHQKAAIEMTKEAAKKNILLYTIGMGSPQGAPIPLTFGNTNNFKTDQSGNIIVSKLNQAILEEMASIGNGIYVNAYSTTNALDIIFEELNKIEKTEFDSKEFTDYEDRFQYLLLPALIILIFEIILNDKKGKLFSKLNLFGKKQ